MMIGIAAAGLALAAAGAVLAPKLVGRKLRRARDDHSRRPDLWNLFYSFDWGETTTNNYGFAPASGNHPQRFQRQMYLELLDRLKRNRPATEGLKLLEVSCGRGGGLAAIREREPGIHAVGLDVAKSAIDYCRRAYGAGDRLDFVVGNALELPFPDASFDAVLNVEASNDYCDRALFFREVARVLKPDGVFLFADTVRAGRQEEIERQLAAAGFSFEWTDITGNVIEACRLDSPRRLEVIRNQAPLLAKLLVGRQLGNYAAVEGSGKYRRFVERRRLYLMTAASRR